MGGPNVAPTPVVPPPADTTKAKIDALNFAELEKQMRRSQGRRSTFLTSGSTNAPVGGGVGGSPMNTSLGQ